MTTSKILQKLITINSVSGNEAEILEWIKQYLIDLSLKPFKIEDNLIVLIKGKNSAKAIIFNTHLDTVTAGNKSLWKIAPFSGKQVDGKIYGLGASDEKGAITSLLLLAEKLVESQPECDVWLTFVSKEELDGSGTKTFLNWFSKNHLKMYTDVAGILGEPTGLTKIEIAHKGNIFLKVTTLGDSGHGSAPKKIKKHSVLEMYKFSQQIKKLGEQWKKKYSDKALGEPTIGLLTSIQSGDKNSPNKFPDTCDATFDIRTTPKLHYVAINEIKALNGEVMIDFMYPPASYGFTDPKGKIAQILQKVSKTKFDVSKGSNDLCFFTEAGIPAVVFGPGEVTAIHKPNEYCELGKIEKCVQLYQEVIKVYGSQYG